MRGARLGLLALVGLVLMPASVAAPPAKKVARIGFLGVTSAADAGRADGPVEAFRKGLRELGYVEGRGVVIEWRFADGKEDRLPPLAGELVVLQPAVLVPPTPFTSSGDRRDLAIDLEVLTIRRSEGSALPDGCDWAVTPWGREPAQARD